MRRALLAVLALAASATAALAADPASREWIGMRVGLWEKVCLKPVLGGTSFTTAASFAGFTPYKSGEYGFRKTEIFASRKGTGDGCACLFSFGSSAPDKAATQVIERLVKTAGSKFAADEDPKSIGTVTTPTGSATVQVLKYKNAGADWLGVTIKGRGVCAT